jgi:hypothetical protein
LGDSTKGVAWLDCVDTGRSVQVRTRNVRPDRPIMVVDGARWSSVTPTPARRQVRLAVRWLAIIAAQTIEAVGGSWAEHQLLQIHGNNLL